MPSYLLIFSQLKISIKLGVGRVVSGKNKTNVRKIFLPGHYNLEILFQLRFTIMGKIKKRGIHPVFYIPRLRLNILNQSLKSSFFPLSIKIKNVLLKIPTTYINPKAVAHAPTADPIACNPKPSISILITQLSHNF